MFAPIRDRFRQGRDVGRRLRRRLAPAGSAARGLAGAGGGYDAVLMPTAPNTAPDRDRLMADGDYYVAENLLTLRNTRVANLMGLPAVTLPTGDAGLRADAVRAPMGEARLLRVARAAEAALPGCLTGCENATTPCQALLLLDRVPVNL